MPVCRAFVSAAGSRAIVLRSFLSFATFETPARARVVVVSRYNFPARSASRMLLAAALRSGCFNWAAAGRNPDVAQNDPDDRREQERVAEQLHRLEDEGGRSQPDPDDEDDHDSGPADTFDERAYREAKEKLDRAGGDH
jgi:hypothetical protein